MTPQDNADAAEIERLKARVRKLAEEKSHLQLIVSLVERLNPLVGLEDMVRAMLYNIMEAIGGTNIKLYYWIEKELHYLDFLGENKILETIDDGVVAEVSRHHEFVELPIDVGDTLLRGEVMPQAWTWAFPLLVGEELVGVVKLENLHIGGASLRNHLPIFFSHAALILSNEIRSHTRRKIEESLREKTEELDSYFNNALDLFCIADTQGYFHKLNPEWEHALGYTLAEFEGRRFLDFVHPDDLQATLDVMSTLSAQQPVLNFANRYRHKNGSYRWLEWRSRPSGTMIFAAAHDITARKNIEAELLHLNAMLELRVKEEATKNREKDLLLIQQSRLAAMGEMVHNIAHQWRQPINALTLLLANIKDAYEFNDLTREYLDKEVKTGQRLIQGMSNTIDEFRNIFMPNKEKEFFLVGAAVDEAINLVNDSFAAHNIKITQEKTGEPCITLGYPNEFAQVVLNALSNAREAISGKGIAGEIHVKTAKDENAITVAISDNGGGIPDKILGKVFDPYFTTKESGSGIGLYMSKMIMDKMGGGITIRNVEGGAEVLISLPLLP